MNVKLLRKVKKHILEEPKRLDMNVLGVRRVGDGAPACNTAACIAGWTCILKHGQEAVGFNRDGDLTINGDANLWHMAIGILGLKGNQEHTLFREPRLARENDGVRLGWPLKFAKRYLRAKTAMTRAKVTAERIDHFIKTKGRE